MLPEIYLCTCVLEIAMVSVWINYMTCCWPAQDWDVNQCWAPADHESRPEFNLQHHPKETFIENNQVHNWWYIRYIWDCSEIQEWWTNVGGWYLVLASKTENWERRDWEHLLRTTTVVSGHRDTPRLNKHSSHGDKDNSVSWRLRWEQLRWSRALRCVAVRRWRSSLQTDCKLG